MKPEPTTAWAVVAPNGNIRTRSIDYSKMAAADLFAEHSMFPWEKWEESGYRVIEVRIVPVEGSESDAS